MSFIEIGRTKYLVNGFFFVCDNLWFSINTVWWSEWEFIQGPVSSTLHIVHMNFGGTRGWVGQDRGGQSLNHATWLQEQVETSGDWTTRFNNGIVHRIQENQLELNSFPPYLLLVS